MIIDPKIITTTNLIREANFEIRRIWELAEEHNPLTEDIHRETLQSLEVKREGLRRYLDTLIHRVDTLPTVEDL